MSVEEIEKKVVKIIRLYLGLKAKIYLFGSWAKGKARPTSDIDIAIEPDKMNKDTEKKFALIREEVDKIRTLRKIDIINLSLTTEKFKDHILKYAVQL